MSKHMEPKCSFCGAPRSEVHKLVQSPLGALICDECLFQAAHLMIFCQPEKVSDITDEPTYDGLSEALDKACRMIQEHIGTCPLDQCDLEIDDTDCDKRCTANIDMAACWRDYFTGKLVTR